MTTMAHSQPRIPPEVELRAVKEELDLARTKLDRYAHLVTKLYDELDTLRSGIYNNCKSKFVPGAASSSSGGRGSSAPSSRSRTNLGGGLAQTQTDLGSRWTEAISHPRNTEPSTKQMSFGPTSVPLPVSVTNSPIAKPDEVDWSVVYNPNVGQALNVHLAYTLKMKSAVHCLKFSQAGKYLAVGLHSGETYMYDINTLSYRILSIVEYPTKEQPSIWAMQFSPDDKYIATGGETGQIRIWNIAERSVLAVFKRHTDPVFAVDFSPDGQSLLSASFDESVRIWRMRDGSSKQLLDTEMTFIASAAISPDSGRYIAAGDYDNMMRIWDFRSRRLLQRWKAGGDLWTVQFTPDGKGLVSGGNDRTVRCWDNIPLMASQSKRGGNTDEEKECLTFQGHKDRVMSISVFPDSRWFLSGSADSTARIWDLQTSDWQCVLNGHQKSVWADASPDRHHLATGCLDGLVRVWRYEHTE